MASMDKIYGTNDQYDELYAWLKHTQPRYVKFLYDRENYNDPNDRMIANFPEYIDKWLWEHCPFQWVKDRLRQQYPSTFGKTTSDDKDGVVFLPKKDGAAGGLTSDLGLFNHYMTKNTPRLKPIKQQAIYFRGHSDSKWDKHESEVVTCSDCGSTIPISRAQAYNNLTLCLFCYHKRPPIKKEHECGNGIDTRIDAEGYHPVTSSMIDDFSSYRPATWTSLVETISKANVEKLNIMAKNIADLRQILDTSGESLPTMKKDDAEKASEENKQKLGGLIYDLTRPSIGWFDTEDALDKWTDDDVERCDICGTPLKSSMIDDEMHNLIEIKGCPNKECEKYQQ